MIVIDASAVGALILQDHGTDYADLLRSSLADDALCAPVHLPVETMHLIVKAHRQGRVEIEQLGLYWDKAQSVIGLADIDPLRVDRLLLELARATGLTPRDAAYLELAQRLGGRLASADKPLLKACKTFGLLTIDPYS